MELKIDLNGLDKTLAVLNPDIYKKAIRQTLNDLGAQVKTQTVKDTRETYNVKAGSLKSKLPEKKATDGNLVWSMEIPRSKQLNVIHFGARAVKSGVSYQVKKGDKRTIIKGGFIGNKNKTVFARIKGTRMTDKTTKYSHSKSGKRFKREKIKAKVALSPSQMISEELRDRKMKEIEEKLPNTFKRNFDHYIIKVAN